MDLVVAENITKDYHIGEVKIRALRTRIREGNPMIAGTSNTAIADMKR